MTRNHWPFLPLGRIYSSPLATLRAFWSLEPQAYLLKTMHKQVIRPHFAVSTCCTLLSTAACWKGHSCEKCLSNYVPDFDLKVQKDFSSILRNFLSNERSRGLHCYSIVWDMVWLLLYNVQDQILLALLISSEVLSCTQGAWTSSKASLDVSSRGRVIRGLRTRNPA